MKYLLLSLCVLALAGCAAQASEPYPNLCVKHGGTAKRIGIDGSLDTSPMWIYVCRDYHIMGFQDGVSWDWKNE